MLQYLQSNKVGLLNSNLRPFNSGSKSKLLWRSQQWPKLSILTMICDFLELKKKYFYLQRNGDYLSQSMI